jgi:nucleotide-binding universal stress UspA family protein
MMKILIAHDGTQDADGLANDLYIAGLPNNADAVLIGVKEKLGSCDWGPLDNRLNAACGKLRTRFPSWTIGATVREGVAGCQILTFADELQPDLIVVGQREKPPGDHNVFLGTVADKILSDAQTCVRISRSAKGKTDHARIMLGFDGSKGSLAAIEAVRRRHWLPKSEAKVVLVSDPQVVSSVGRFATQLSAAAVEGRVVRQWAETLAETQLQTLENAGLSTEFQLATGNPTSTLVEMAERFHVNTIFVGPNRGGNSFDRFLLGSVSAAVAARANCSVEVVR